MNERCWRAVLKGLNRVFVHPFRTTNCWTIYFWFTLSVIIMSAFYSSRKMGNALTKGAWMRWVRFVSGKYYCQSSSHAFRFLAALYRIRVNDFESIMERGMLAIIGSQPYKQDIAALNTNDEMCAHTTSCCSAKALKKMIAYCSYVV